jgi:exodeoxyribonuclease VII small subunit
MAEKEKNTSEVNKDVSFEKAVEELNEIVDILEGGQAPLEEAMELFKRGIELTKICQNKLDSAEQKITKLIDDGDEVKEVPFEAEKA